MEKQIGNIQQAQQHFLLGKFSKVKYFRPTFPEALNGIAVLKNLGNFPRKYL